MAPDPLESQDSSSILAQAQGDGDQSDPLLQDQGEIWRAKHMHTVALQHMFMYLPGVELALLPSRAAATRGGEGVFAKVAFPQGALVTNFVGCVTVLPESRSLQRHQMRLPGTCMAIDWSMHLLPSRHPFCLAGKINHSNDDALVNMKLKFLQVEVEVKLRPTTAQIPAIQARVKSKPLLNIPAESPSKELGDPKPEVPEVPEGLSCAFDPAQGVLPHSGILSVPFLVNIKDIAEGEELLYTYPPEAAVVLSTLRSFANLIRSDQIQVTNQPTNYICCRPQ